MKAKKLLVLGLAAVLVTGSLVILKVHAETSASVHPRIGRFLAKAKEKLNLTDDQVAQIKAQLATDKDKLTGLLSSLHDAHIALREVIQKPGSTEADLRAASAKVAAVESDLAIERASLYGRISPILTADQLAKISDFEQRVDDFIDGAIAVFGKRLAE